MVLSVCSTIDMLCTTIVQYIRTCTCSMHVHVVHNNTCTCGTLRVCGMYVSGLVIVFPFWLLITLHVVGNNIKLLCDECLCVCVCCDGCVKVGHVVCM